MAQSPIHLFKYLYNLYFSSWTLFLGNGFHKLLCPQCELGWSFTCSPLLNSKGCLFQSINKNLEEKFMFHLSILLVIFRLQFYPALVSLPSCSRPHPLDPSLKFCCIFLEVIRVLKVNFALLSPGILQNCFLSNLFPPFLPVSSTSTFIYLILYPR